MSNVNKSLSVCDYLIVDVPLPPSLNALFEPHKIGNRVSVGKSSRYKKYQKNVFIPHWYRVRQLGKFDVGDAIMIWMVMCPPRKGCDIDNYTKCLFDTLQHDAVSAIKDDNLVVSHRIEKGPRVTGGLLRVHIANERHRERLTIDFERELHELWLPQRDGKDILKHPGYRIHRVDPD